VRRGYVSDSGDLTAIACIAIAPTSGAMHCHPVRRYPDRSGVSVLRVSVWAYRAAPVAVGVVCVVLGLAVRALACVVAGDLRRAGWRWRRRNVTLGTRTLRHVSRWLVAVGQAWTVGGAL